MSPPNPLDFYSSVLLEAFSDVLASKVASEHFLDGDGCPLLHILHPFSFHFSLSLSLGVLNFEVSLAIGIEA